MFSNKKYILNLLIIILLEFSSVYGRENQLGQTENLEKLKQQTAQEIVSKSFELEMEEIKNKLDIIENERIQNLNMEMSQVTGSLMKKLTTNMQTIVTEFEQQTHKLFNTLQKELTEEYLKESIKRSGTADQLEIEIGIAKGYREESEEKTKKLIERERMLEEKEKEKRRNEEIEQEILQNVMKAQEISKDMRKSSEDVAKMSENLRYAQTQVAEAQSEASRIQKELTEEVTKRSIVIDRLEKEREKVALQKEQLEEKTKELIEKEKKLKEQEQELEKQKKILKIREVGIEETNKEIVKLFKENQEFKRQLLTK